MKLAAYKSFVFDCDGVILNSNQVKTQAFYNAALPYGQGAAQALVDYHVQRGGVSRYVKFAYFLTDILQKDANDEELKALLKAFSEEVKKGLLSCEVATGLAELRKRTETANWLIVSGGDQEELREVFTRRGLAAMFDGGIFGSPTPKEQILVEQQQRGNIQPHALFLGDSKYDLQAARSIGLDFIFISGWTEMKSWQSFCRKNNILNISRLSSLVNHSAGHCRLPD